jgi:hypothetical protein
MERKAERAAVKASREAERVRMLDAEPQEALAAKVAALHIKASLHPDRYATDPRKRQLLEELSKEFGALTIVSDE